MNISEDSTIISQERSNSITVPYKLTTSLSVLEHLAFINTALEIYEDQEYQQSLLLTKGKEVENYCNESNIKPTLVHNISFNVVCVFDLTKAKFHFIDFKTTTSFDTWCGCDLNPYNGYTIMKCQQMEIFLHETSRHLAVFSTEMKIMSWDLKMGAGTKHTRKCSRCNISTEFYNSEWKRTEAPEFEEERTCTQPKIYLCMEFMFTEGGDTTETTRSFLIILIKKALHQI